MSVVATPTGLEPATSAVTERADGRWLSMGVAGPLEFAGLRAFETLGSRWVFSGLLLPQCCPTEIIFSRDGVEPAQLAAVVSMPRRRQGLAEQAGDVLQCHQVGQLEHCRLAATERHHHSPSCAQQQRRPQVR
jgi:hypothetical protein